MKKVLISQIRLLFMLLLYVPTSNCSANIGVAHNNMSNTTPDFNTTSSAPVSMSVAIRLSCTQPIINEFVKNITSIDLLHAKKMELEQEIKSIEAALNSPRKNKKNIKSRATHQKNNQLKNARQKLACLTEWVPPFTLEWESPFVSDWIPELTADSEVKIVTVS